MSSAATEVRYSTGVNNIGEAKNFNWEYPVPVNSFWNDIDFNTARSFFLAFSNEEIEKLPSQLDQEGSLGQKEKLELLLKILRSKLETEDQVNAPKTFYNVNYKAWVKVWLGIAGLQSALHDPEVEETLRMLINKREDKEDMSQVHGLAGVLFDKGKYTEVEELEPRAIEWLDKKLGKSSPQAISARQLLAEAIWKQDTSRKEESIKLFSEIDGHIAEMSGSKYEVYQKEQRDILNQAQAELEG